MSRTKQNTSAIRNSLLDKSSLPKLKIAGFVPYPLPLTLSSHNSALYSHSHIWLG